MNNTRQPKPDPLFFPYYFFKEKAVASFVLGIVGIGPAIMIILSIIGLQGDFFLKLYFALVFLGPLAGLVGLILGIFGLKSTKRNLAKVGIVLCIIGLLIPFYLISHQEWLGAD